MNNKPDRVPGYHSFLIRLWRENDNLAAKHPERPVWRASLQHPDTGEQIVFANLEELVDYLYEITSSLS